MKNLSRGVIFRAVSSKAQAKADKKSLDDQLEVCKSYCNKNGIKVIKVLTSTESRSSKAINPLYESKNPAYKQIIDLCESGEIDTFVYDRHDRIARDYLLAEQVARLCLNNGISMHEATSGEVITSKEDPLPRLIKAYSANRAVKTTSMINLRSRIRRNEQGLFPKVPPFGYAYEYKKDGTKYVIDVPHEQKIVLRIFELYLQGHGTSPISKILYSEGHDIPQYKVRWIILSVWNYAGYVVFHIGRKGKGYKVPVGEDETAHKHRGQHNAIINDDMARAVEEEAVKRSINNALGRKRHKYSRMVYCQSCGSAMVAGRYFRKRKNEYATLYRCNDRFCDYRRKSVLEDNITKLIIEKLRNEIEEIAKIDQDRVAKKDDISERIKSVEDSIKRQDRKLLNIARKFAETGDDGVFDLVREEINQEKAALEMQLKRLKESEPMTQDEKIEFLQEIIEFVLDAPPESVNPEITKLYIVKYDPSNKEITVIDLP